MFDAKNILCSCDPKQGKFISASTLFRGNIQTGEVETQMTLYKKKNLDCFVDWVHNNFIPIVCDVPPLKL